MKSVIVACICLMSITSFAQEAGTQTTLTFEEAVKIGLKRNVLLNQQKNQLMATQAQRLSAFGNFLPNLNVTGSYQHQSGQQQNTTSGDLENIDTDYIGAQFNANYTLFNGLRSINTLGQANNQLSAQSYLVKRNTQDVVSTIANQYLLVLLDQELLKIADENLKTQQTLRDQMQGFYDVGARAITDLYNQDALMKAAQVAFIRARNTLQNDKSVLAQTLQLDPSQTFEVSYPELGPDLLTYPKLSVDSLISIAMTNRADLKQLSYQAEANKFAMKAAFAGYLPNITLYGNYGSFYYSLIQDNFNNQFKTLNPSTSYGANLTIPIFSRFLTRSQRATAKVVYDNSLLNKENIDKTVRLDVQRAVNNMINAIEGYQSSLAQFEAGELALQTQKESYELGISAQVALAQANQTYVQGASSKAQAEVTLLFQRILLDYALGTLKVEDFIKQ